MNLWSCCMAPNNIYRVRTAALDFKTQFYDIVVLCHVISFYNRGKRCILIIVLILPGKTWREMILRIKTSRKARMNFFYLKSCFRENETWKFMGRVLFSSNFNDMNFTIYCLYQYIYFLKYSGRRIVCNLTHTGEI